MHLNQKKLSDHYSDEKVMRYREILNLNKVSSKVDYSDYILPSEDEIVKFIDSLISF